MRTWFMAAGLALCLIGGAIIFYQVSESCEDAGLSSVYSGYPWCVDILDHINLTFVGVMAVVGGVLVLALGSSLHWFLEPVSPGEPV